MAIEADLTNKQLAEIAKVKDALAKEIEELKKNGKNKNKNRKRKKKKRKREKKKEKKKYST